MIGDYMTRAIIGVPRVRNGYAGSPYTRPPQYNEPPAPILRWMRRPTEPVWHVELQQRHNVSGTAHRVKYVFARAPNARVAAERACREYRDLYGTFAGAWYARVKRARMPLSGPWPWLWRDAGFVIGAEKDASWVMVRADYAQKVGDNG